VRYAMQVDALLPWLTHQQRKNELERAMARNEVVISEQSSENGRRM